MTNASMLRILAHATPTPTSRSKGQSQSHGAGAYCGGHLAAQLVYSNIKEVLFGQKKPVLSKFAAGFRHAFDLLATGFRPGLQLARIMGCGLYCLKIQQ